MKKVIVVSKTHLDLGFTDFASVVCETYRNTYIPNAISLARELNTPQRKRFIWTTGSWILQDTLQNGTKKQKEALTAALQRGDIVPHALPFTTHTELLDADTLEYGLSIVEKLDKLRGKKTIAAKMTDVPGHTKALVPLLARHGIKLLHLGVNGASALAKVPPCFLWKCDGAEVVVIYSGDYGGAFQDPRVEEVLYFDHTLDNHGTPSADHILKKLKAIEQQFPGYTVEAGTMDEIAEVLWEKRHDLPVVTEEIGDTWIHGSAADPYKSAALRELMARKRKWLADGSMTRESAEYAGFSDALLCIAEHTCGMDMKKYFSDYEHYLKPDFEAARKKDCVHVHHPFRDFPQNFLVVIGRLAREKKPCSYSTMEQSWAEQRAYVQKALDALSPAHKKEALSALAALRPEQPEEITDAASLQAHAPLVCGKWQLTLNELGGIESLTCNGKEVLRQNDSPLCEYRSFGAEDYDYWLQHYTRNIKETYAWAVGDFARPLLKYVSGKYPTGRFPYTCTAASAPQVTDDAAEITLHLTCDQAVCEQLGAPRLVQVVYRLTNAGLQMEVSWFGKDANRLTEAFYLHLFPAKGGFTVHKLGTDLSPFDVVSMGSRSLHAVECAKLQTEDGIFELRSCHAPLLCLGKGKILEFDDKTEDIERDGITYILQDNVWGTNFPLWYSDNARFVFTVREAEADAAEK